MNLFSLVASLLGALASVVVFAQPVKGGGVSGVSDRRQIIEEIVHDFEVVSYPDGRVVGGRKSIDRIDSEATLAGWIDALGRLGYSDVMDFWDESAKNKIANENKKSGKTPVQWEGDWRSLLAGKRVIYRHKIVYGSYVIFDLEFVDSSDQVIYRELVSLKRAPQGWHLTRDLANSVVLQNWNSSQSRVRRLAAPLYEKIDGGRR